MKPHIANWLCRAVVLSGIAVFGPAASAANYYEGILQGRNIQPTSEGIGNYLNSLHPTPDQQQRVARLIKQLGDADSFARREKAMSALLLMPVLPNEALIAAGDGGDPEIRWRAKMILRIGKPESEKVLYATFKTVSEKRLPGLAGELLRAIPLCDKGHLVFAAREALEESARAEDAAALREGMRSSNPQVQAAAVAALGSALGKKAADDLKPLLRSATDEVKLAAARALANLGDRTALEPLVGLLGSDKVAVRVSSSVVLRELSGKSFGFAAYDTAGKRTAAINRWRDWAAGEGQKAKLKFPLTPYGSKISYLGGNTLLAFGYRKKVAEIDPQGKEIWSFTAIRSAWSAEKLANGNYLIAAYQDNKVIEVDSQKNIVWEYPGTNCLNARPLLNGNILISEISGRKVIEVDRQKNIVWKHEPGGSVYDAHRLENGNTIMAIPGWIREITPGGKAVWQYKMQNSHGFQPLPNGNVLICDSSRNRVVEVNREKRVLWEHTENYPVDVFRLPNGNTLITGNQRFTEVTRDKRVIWSMTGCSYGSARR